MDLGKIPTLVVGLVVAILIVTVVAIPIIDDASKEIRSTENNTNYRFMATSDITDVVTIQMKSDNSGWLVNGKEFTTQGLNVISDGLILNVTGVGDANVHIFTGENANTELYSSIGSVVFDNGTWTLTKTNDTVITGTYTFVLYPVNDGPMGYFWGNNHNVSVKDTYYLRITELTFYTGDDGSKYSATAVIKMIGNNASLVKGFIKITDSSGSISHVPMTSNMIRSASGATLSDDGRSYTVQSINLDVAYNAGNVSQHTITTNTMFSPVSYDYLSESDKSIISIIDVIPILLIVSMLVAIVGTVFVRNN